jgi:uncharacterized protein (TIGR00255 family)
MTGFARVRETIQGVDIVLSVKTVNHRGLDIHFYTGVELDPFENAMRAAIKRSLSRGHVDVRAQLSRSGAATGPLGVDYERLDAYIEAFRESCTRYALNGDPDLNVAFRLPGILSDSAALELGEAFEPPLVALLQHALDTLRAFREREGGEIAGLMKERAGSVARTADEIEILRAGAMPAYQVRLRERLTDLLSGSAIDSQRIVQEAALLADRSDIHEEIERLRIHSRQVSEILERGDEVGKKLDFLLQEMNRETNTILSKTSGLGEAGLRITELAVQAKSDVEKMREQSLNLE